MKKHNLKYYKIPSIANSRIGCLPYSLFWIFLLLLVCIGFWYYLKTSQTRNLLIDQLAIFAIAILIDLGIGDPPERVEKFYPIVWISRLINFFDRLTRRGNARKEKIWGAVYAMFTVSVFSLPCLLLIFIPYELIYVILGSLIFKMTFTIKGLERYGIKAMEAVNLEDKREAVDKIVSRDVTDLDMEHLNSAAIESVAENTTDSVIAPFFYFALFGVFGAMVYRVLNTLDAVVGYKTTRHINFGWFSAKADDMMNYIPERIAAGLIKLTSDTRRLRRRSYKKTETERVHLTIAAMSHALNVKLEKIGHYSVEEISFKAARSEHIGAAIRIAKRSTFLFAFVCSAFMTAIYFLVSVLLR